MSDIDIHHLAAAYALDALDSHERAAFEAHYPAATCAGPTFSSSDRHWPWWRRPKPFPHPPISSGG